MTKVQTIRPDLDEEAALSYEPFQGDETDVRELEDKFVNGAREHKCQHCYGPIPKGERHRAKTEVNREDKQVQTFRFCRECCYAFAISDDDSGKLVTERQEMYR